MVNALERWYGVNLQGFCAGRAHQPICGALQLLAHEKQNLFLLSRWQVGQPCKELEWIAACTACSATQARLIMGKARR
jgi:ribosomal protein S27AE